MGYGCTTMEPVQIWWCYVALILGREVKQHNSQGKHHSYKTPTPMMLNELRNPGKWKKIVYYFLLPDEGNHQKTKAISGQNPSLKI